MEILFIGDIVGDAAVEYLYENLPHIRRSQGIGLCIANGENCAPDGLGITEDAAHRLLSAGVDAITLGNHFRSKKRDLENLFDDGLPLVRPLNIKTHIGSGTLLLDMGPTQVGIINLSGRAFSTLEMSNPFLDVLPEIQRLREQTNLILIDFHAEATSEKLALLHHLKGSVTAILGTHTHVQTSDAMVADGTAYITDVGMTGPRPSVLGSDADKALGRFLHETSDKLSVAEGEIELNSVVIDVDPATGKAQNIVCLNR